MLYLSIFSLTLVRANLTRVTSPPNSNTGGSRLIFSVLYSYFIFIFYLPRCTLPDFPSVSSLASLPFLSCCHRTTTERREPLGQTRITAQSIFFNLRKVDNSNKWKNYVIATRVKLSVQLDALVVR